MKHRPGDIVFIYDPNPFNLVSSAIMITSTDKLKHGKVPYHMAIIYDRYHLIESVWGSGVRKVMIDHYDRKRYHIWHKRLIPDLWPEDALLTEQMLQNWLTQQIGKPYDRWQIVSIFARSFLRIIPPLYRYVKKRTSLLDSRFRFLCSELIYRAYTEVFNIDLYPSANASTVTPFDISRSELLEEIK